MARVAAESSARALQYGPTEGLLETRETIATVMAGRGRDGRPGRRARHDRRTAGHRARLQDADRSRRRDRRRRPDLSRRRPDLLRLPGRRRADRDGRRRDARRRAGGDARPARPRGTAAEVHLHGADVPEPGRRDAVAGAPPAARRDRAASASCSCSRTTPTALLRYEGEALPTLLRARRRRVRDLLGTFSKILSPGMRLGWAVAPRPVLEKLNLGTQGATLCPSSFTQLFVAAYFATRALGAIHRRAARALPRAAATRCSRRSPRTSRRRRRGRGRRAGCSSGRRCPSTSTRPTCWRSRCREQRRVRPRARARILDGRGGSSMRLNFSGFSRGGHPRGRTPDRRDRRRAGRALRDADRAAGPAAAGRRPPAAPTRSSPTSCALPRASGAGASAPMSAVRVAVLKGGRSLERQVSLRVGRPGRGRARAPRPRGDGDRRRPRPGRRLRELAPDVASSRCTAATARTARSRSCSRSLGIPYTGSRRRRACAAADKVLAKHAAARGRHADARLLRLQRDGVQGARRGRRARRRSSSGSASRSSSSRLTRARRSASSSPRAAGRRARRAGRGVLATRDEGAARALRRRARPRGLDPRRRGPLPIVEAVPQSEDFYDFEARYEIGRTELRLPGRPRRPSVTASARRSSRSHAHELLGCGGFSRVDLMLDARSGELQVLEVNTIPGLTETSLLPQAAEAAGIGVRRADRSSARARPARWRPASVGAERAQLAPPAKSSGVTWSRKSLNWSTTSSVSSTSCSNSIADSAMTSSAAKIGAPERTASASASDGRESISISRAVDRQRDRGEEGVVAQLGDRDLRAA